MLSKFVTAYLEMWSEPANNDSCKLLLDFLFRNSWLKQAKFNAWFELFSISEKVTL